MKSNQLLRLGKIDNLITLIIYFTYIANFVNMLHKAS